MSGNLGDDTCNRLLSELNTVSDSTTRAGTPGSTSYSQSSPSGSASGRGSGYGYSYSSSSSSSTSTRATTGFLNGVVHSAIGDVLGSSNTSSSSSYGRGSSSR